MSPKVTPELNVLPTGVEEPVADYEVVMAKIQYDSHQDYNGMENAALQNEDIEKKKGEGENENEVKK
jgi:hypothetical protein